MTVHPAVVVTVAAGAVAGFVWLLPTPAEPSPGALETTFAITHVRVFDGEQVHENATILVRDGRIESVNGVLDHRPALDGTGRTVLPGLIDSHTHAFGTALGDALRFGVTTELDMFSVLAELRDHQPQRQALRRTDEADFYSAGSLATVPRGHGTEYGIAVPTLTTPAEAEPWVAARVNEGSDYIKLVYEPGARFPSLDRATAAALIVAAHHHQRLAVAHLSRREAAEALATDGVDGLVHLFADHPVTAEVVAQLKAHAVFVVPTLVVLTSLTAGGSEANAVAADPSVAPFLSAAQHNALEGDWSRLDAPLDFAHACGAVQALRDAGIDLLAGTDAGNRGAAHGASLHHELELLVRCGLTPREALTAATSAPARRFHLGDRGRLAPGHRADLLLVQGDPLSDIHATRSIVSIWKNGFQVSRHAQP